MDNGPLDALCDACTVMLYFIGLGRVVVAAVTVAVLVMLRGVVGRAFWGSYDFVKELGGQVVVSRFACRQKGMGMNGSERS